MAGRGVDRPPYPVALRLYTVAAVRWAEVEAAYYQIDLLTVGPRKFLNLVYAWCVQWMDPEKREEWEQALNAPMEGTRHPTDLQLEQEGADFMATLQMHQQLEG